MSLQDAAEGLREYTTEVEGVYHSLKHNRVPQVVAAASYPMGFGLFSWLNNLKRRVEFMSLWLHEGPPHPFWLPGCFSARAVCKAMLQQFARQTGLRVDAVGFAFTVLPPVEKEIDSDAFQERQYGEEPSRPPFAHDVSGLFLHGASWSPEDMVRLLHPHSSDGTLYVLSLRKHVKYRCLQLRPTAS